MSTFAYVLLLLSVYFLARAVVEDNFSKLEIQIRDNNEEVLGLYEQRPERSSLWFGFWWFSFLFILTQVLP